MVQLKIDSAEAWGEVLRLLENLQVHHKAGNERFWTPRESYQLWKAMYDAISAEINVLEE